MYVLFRCGLRGLRNTKACEFSLKTRTVFLDSPSAQTGRNPARNAKIRRPCVSKTPAECTETERTCLPHPSSGFLFRWQLGFT